MSGSRRSGPSRRAPVRVYSADQRNEIGVRYDGTPGRQHPAHGRSTAIDQLIDEVTVVASQVATVNLAIGPGSAFDLADISSMPSIQRQIRDVIRVDPRVSLGRSDNGAGSGINCLGGAPRSNAITIDGAIANDGFGLNEGTGTSARFAFPIPYDTIQSASVEFAPLDVQYSQFTGCAINVVTRPGSNEFHGSAFYLFNDESLTGDTLNGDQVITDPFEDKNYGFIFSGPIIQDTLFFQVAYEETDEGGNFQCDVDDSVYRTQLGIRYSFQARKETPPLGNTPRRRDRFLITA